MSLAENWRVLDRVGDCVNVLEYECLYNRTLAIESNCIGFRQWTFWGAEDGDLAQRELFEEFWSLVGYAHFNVGINFNLGADILGSDLSLEYGNVVWVREDFL